MGVDILLAAQEILLNSPLFSDIGADELSAILTCISAFVKNYDKDEVIFLAGDSVHHVGVVMHGSVQIIKEDMLGNRNIVAHIEEAGVFGEEVVCAGMAESPVTAISVEPSEIMFLNFSRVLTFCDKACNFHAHLIENLLKILARNNLAINKKLDFISMRTIRERLTQYLLYQYQEQEKNPVVLPLNRNQLADYLCVDRSAMSRELSKMKAEGLISYKKYEFTLHQLQA